MVFGKMRLKATNELIEIPDVANRQLIYKPVSV